MRSTQYYGASLRTGARGLETVLYASPSPHPQSVTESGAPRALCGHSCEGYGKARAVSLRPAQVKAVSGRGVALPCASFPSAVGFFFRAEQE